MLGVPMIKAAQNGRQSGGGNYAGTGVVTSAVAGWRQGKGASQVKGSRSLGGGAKAKRGGRRQRRWQHAVRLRLLVDAIDLIAFFAVIMVVVLVNYQQQPQGQRTSSI